MKVRKVILSTFLLTALLYTFIDERVAVWQVLVPIFLLGLLLVREEWSDNWLYLVIAIQILLLFYFGTIGSPFSWLTAHNVMFGPAVVGTILFIFATTGLSVAAVYLLLRQLKGRRHE